jgi:hypothetical protein
MVKVKERKEGKEGNKAARCCEPAMKDGGSWWLVVGG